MKRMLIMIGLFISLVSLPAHVSAQPYISMPSLCFISHKGVRVSKTFYCDFKFYA